MLLALYLAVVLFELFTVTFCIMQKLISMDYMRKKHGAIHLLTIQDMNIHMLNGHLLFNFLLSYIKCNASVSPVHVITDIIQQSALCTPLYVKCNPKMYPICILISNLIIQQYIEQSTNVETDLAHNNIVSYKKNLKQIIY